jgi:hypothetical protein
MTPSRAFVSDPPVDASVTAAYEDDLASDGYINNSTRVWCWRPDVLASFQTLRAGLTDSSDLSDREVAVMVAATAAARGDPYCSLAWGARLAELSDEATAECSKATRAARRAGRLLSRIGRARWCSTRTRRHKPMWTAYETLASAIARFLRQRRSLRFGWRSRPSTAHSAHSQTRN